VGCRELRSGALTFLAREVNRDANRVRDCCHGNDFHRETQWAWNVDDWINSEENRGQRNECTANSRYAQPDWSARPNRSRSEDRDREHREINDAVENVRGVIDQLKCFLNARADLARDGNSERKRTDENDRVDRRFELRMQT